MCKRIPLLSICVDKYLEGATYDKSEQLSLGDLRSANREELALAKYKLWQPGQSLRIVFFDGDPVLQNRIKEVAVEWLNYANLEFIFGNFPDAQIKVTFNGNGYWSLIGTDAAKQNSSMATMSLGGFTKNTDELEMRRVVLHEFGHAIGCVHEQASPTTPIPWDVQKVYAYYWHHYGWNCEIVDRNILERYSQSTVEYTENHDPKSIMQYPVPNELTIGDFEIGWNTELSETDKKFIAEMYPK